MPRYSALRDALVTTPPIGWDLEPTIQGGIHLWPDQAKKRSEISSMYGVRQYVGLYEIHVLESGKARLLLRLRHSPEHRERFNALGTSAREFGCPAPTHGIPDETGSVAMWQIEPNTNFANLSDNAVANLLAEAIRQFLLNPPENFTQMRDHVVRYFGNEANW
jgi:hypothetical protein